MVKPKAYLAAIKCKQQELQLTIRMSFFNKTIDDVTVTTLLISQLYRYFYLHLMFYVIHFSSIVFIRTNLLHHLCWLVPLDGH